MNIKRGILAAALVAAAAVPAAWAAGMWSNWPVVGGSTYCGAIVGSGPTQGGTTGQGAGAVGGSTICAQTVPAGPPALTGAEEIPADLESSGTGPVQSVKIPSGMLGGSTNRLIGGDFNTNLWQRGTTPLSAATPSTPVIGADRWAVYSSGNTVTVIKETGTADTIPAQGLYASMRVSRPSSTNTSQICVGQVLDKQAAAPLIGNNAVFSFWALAGAGLNAVDSGNNITATIAYYTAGDSATPFTNTSTFMQGTTTGYAAAVGGVSNGTTGTVASGIATIPISTTWTRYAVWASIPATNASGTAITGAGVTVCYTPASGTGGSTEWFELAGAQLQALSSAVTQSLPNGITSPTAFERRYPAVEAALQEYYTTGGGLGAEVAAQYYQYGTCKASGNFNAGIVFPVPMRTAPTSATSTLTTGGYSIQTAATVVAGGTLSIPSGAASVYGATLNSTAACTTTLPYELVGSNTTGLVLFSAEP